MPGAVDQLTTTMTRTPNAWHAERNQRSSEKEKPHHPIHIIRTWPASFRPSASTDGECCLVFWHSLKDDKITIKTKNKDSSPVSQHRTCKWPQRCPLVFCFYLSGILLASTRALTLTLKLLCTPYSEQVVLGMVLCRRVSLVSARILFAQ